MIVTQQVKKFPAFYGTKRALPCLQQHSTGPYPEPVEISPHLQTLF